MTMGFNRITWGYRFLGERLGSGDGEGGTLLTRQIASEPLPASVLFGLACHLSFLAIQIPSIVPPIATAATPPVAMMAPAYMLPPPMAANPLVNPAADKPPTVPAEEIAAAAVPAPANAPTVPPLVAPITSSCFMVFGRGRGYCPERFRSVPILASLRVALPVGDLSAAFLIPSFLSAAPRDASFRVLRGIVVLLVW